MLPETTDIAIVGAGIVGLATAYRLSESMPDKRIVILEKEDRVASHQTGNNSGVIHSGIYYKPGSLKAENCTKGKHQLEEFCKHNGIAVEKTGKIIIASQESDLATLTTLYERGNRNGLNCRYLPREEIQEFEPNAIGLKGLLVPEAGIVDYEAVCMKLVELLSAAGITVYTNTKVINGRSSADSICLETTKGAVQAKLTVNCGGLYSDKLAKLLGHSPKMQIIPFRGEYYSLSTEAAQLCKGLIYPTPNLDFPFLEVHLTKKINGAVECGPNAVLAYAREGYRKFDINLAELFHTLNYPGFRKLARRYYRQGAKEFVRSYSKLLFLKSLQKLVPEISYGDLKPGGSGVRAQAVSPDGKLIDDFLIERSAHAIHVLNAPSPAATSALNIGHVIAGYAREVWK